ncbi:MAG: DivIVA domain-containing protein [Clostridia bacterium]|nr:DivIVA domain-containing protein [Clostridia bacterium]
MLSPSELKKRQFGRSLRGYSVSEVDEHMNFVLEKYTELYRRNDELEKELARLQGELERLKANEDAIRRAMVNAQREERKIIDEANDRASLILRTAKLNTDRMLSEFKAKIREERVVLHKLRSAVREFKENSLRQYQLHLEFLNQISPDLGATDPELEMTEDDYANSLLEQMKLDIESGRVIGEEEDTLPAHSPAPRRTGTREDGKRQRAAERQDEDPRAKTAVFDKVKRQPSDVPDDKTREIRIPKKK